VSGQGAQQTELVTWVTDEVRARFEQAGYWTDEVWLDRTISNTKDAPEALCVVDESGQLTRAEALAYARRLAAYLYHRGIRKGDVVTLLLPNWREFVVVHHAVGLLGAVVNPVLPKVGANELAHILRTGRSRFVIAAETYREHSPRQVAARVACGIDSVIDVMPVRAAGGSLASILETPWETRVAVPAARIDPRGWDTVTFTSGTEAMPKGVVHSHQTTMFGLRAFTVGVLGQDSSDVVFMPSPLCHATGLQWGLRAALYVGAPLVLQDRWDPAVALRLINQYRCTYTLVAATFIVDLLRARADGARMGKSLRYVATGGAPIPRDLARRTRASLGAELVAVFGASETYVTTATRPSWPENLLATEGMPLPGVEVQITDETGKPAPREREGEICTRGPHVFLGYLGDPDLTHRAFRGDWYRFGDLGRLDDSGMLHVTGRIKDIVIRGGENISVREVEDHLLQHQDVLEVAVVGYPDDRLGERCCAVVVPRAHSALTLHALTAFLTERGLPKFKLPERLELVSEMPKTTTGKIRKAELRRWLGSAATDGSEVARSDR
jgi:acyl-CoA synthetase (AMP-forming)/AMP-acid ligase II